MRKQILEKIGVEVLLDAKVVDVNAEGVTYEGKDGTRTVIPCACKIWAAGVSGSPLGRLLAERAGSEVDRAGRVHVDPDLTLPGHPEVFVVGDLMALDNLPGVAQVAIQGGRHAAATIRARIEAKPEPGPFKYKDKGSMATITRFSAVTKVGRFEQAGFLAWVLWLVVHLMYIVGFKNRLTTLVHWFVSFIGRNRAERSVSPQQVVARNRLRNDGIPIWPGAVGEGIRFAVVEEDPPPAEEDIRVAVVPEEDPPPAEEGIRVAVLPEEDPSLTDEGVQVAVVPVGEVSPAEEGIRVAVVPQEETAPGVERA